MYYSPASCLLKESIAVLGHVPREKTTILPHYLKPLYPVLILSSSPNDSFTGSYILSKNVSHLTFFLQYLKSVFRSMY